MMFRGKTAIVTGSGRGMGRAIAEALAREGARVVVCARTQAEIDQVVAGIRADGGDAEAARVDATRREEVEALVRGVLQKWGRIHILVNNVGRSQIQPFVESTEEAWDRDIAVNFKSALFFTHAVLRSMVEHGYGKIVNISSAAGRIGQGGVVLYSAAKSALIGFTKALAREMARHKINVNCICPGAIDTSLWQEGVARAPGYAEALKKTIPWKRVGKPEEIAAAVVFLASDGAEYMTGQVISVDGGATML